jgi:hypothetical protein
MSDAQIVARVAARTLNRVAGHGVKNLIQDLVLKDQTTNLQRLVQSGSKAADAIDDWAEANTTVPRSQEDMAALGFLVNRFKFFAQEMLKILDVHEHMSRENLAAYFSQYTRDGEGDAPFHESHEKFDEAAKQLNYLREGVQNLRAKWYYLWFNDKNTTSEEISKDVYELASEMAFCRTVYRQFREPMVEVMKMYQNIPGFRRL